MFSSRALTPIGLYNGNAVLCNLPTETYLYVDFFVLTREQITLHKTLRSKNKSCKFLGLNSLTNTGVC
jgi:hypothetical protein